MRKSFFTLTVISAAMLLFSCNSTKPKDITSSDNPVVISLGEVRPDLPVGGKIFVPHARIYRTNGNYNENVPIQVAPDGKSIISFPAPSDLREATPLSVADNWLLDRRGVGVDTRFTSYTYTQYAALASPPSISELLHSVIPTAMITELVELPLTIPEALSDTSAVNLLIRKGLPDCKFIIMAPATAPEE